MLDSVHYSHFLSRDNELESHVFDVLSRDYEYFAECLNLNPADSSPDIILECIDEYVGTFFLQDVQYRSNSDFHSKAYVTIDETRSEGDIVKKLSVMHNLFGHPPNTRFVELLRIGKYSDRVIELAKKINCHSCDALKTPPQHALVSEIVVTNFNERVQVDIFEVSGNKVLHFIDCCTKYSLCIPIRDRKCETLISGLFDWLSLFLSLIHI